MIYEKIKELCIQNGISVNELEKRIDVAKGSLCKIDKHKPSAEKISRIEKELNAPDGYLYGKKGSERPKELYTKEDLELLALIKKLNREQKDNIINTIKSFTLQ